MKVISPQAYVALREVLTVIVWRKAAFETYVRGAFGHHPEVLSGINFDLPKRENASKIMDRLMADVSRYQESTINVMLDIASMTRLTLMLRRSRTPQTVKYGATRRRTRFPSCAITPPAPSRFAPPNVSVRPRVPHTTDRPPRSDSSRMTSNPSARIS